MRIGELPTPAAVVDLDVLQRNLSRMAQRAAALGVALRPHFKTHKCVEVARLQSACGVRGFTVSTLAEARALLAAGFGDLVWAVPLSPGRLDEACLLARKAEHFAFLVDSPEASDSLDARGRRAAERHEVLLEVDCGYHRSGVDPGAGESVALAERLAAARGLSFRGLLTHAGHAYACRDRRGAEAVAAEEREVTVGFAQRLREEGVAVEQVSVGSTPTVLAADHLRGVTEVRPGNYVFFDAFQAAIGSCTLADCAFTVLATVTSANGKEGRFALDAGALALSKDPGPVHVDPRCGFGVLLPGEGGAPLHDLVLAALSQEHGHGRTRPGREKPPQVGDRIRVIPNHSCLAAAAFETFYAVQAGEVVELWHPARGW